ncbi:SMC-Scp complex subunit ScpB [Corynebacterium sp. sy039]|uniref:SMC-Scp complex subunit ScpB n=1 Tax=Corynebacterium sp. sy039 TaxID=2599641 RepID=UPI0011B5DAF1|nr:SMC-Scp complex subunit ScpB [Corynebacterium sp. sy039]QDZ42567.1 SMC-Scp complex subunit ScpB [Corynebacterium sp. sy039]
MQEISVLRSQVESILLVVDTPVSSQDIARVTNSEEASVRAVLKEIQEELVHRGSGIDLRFSDEGWRFYTLQKNSEVVEKFLLDGTHTKLSRAALETLAVIAYRQPATRAQVAAIRGVNVDGVIRTLQLRGLIREADIPEETHGAHYYVTTELFLEQLGIDSLDRLPDLAPLLPDIDGIDEQL